MQWSKTLLPATVKCGTRLATEFGILHSTSSFYSLELQSVPSLAVVHVVQSRRVHSRSWHANSRSYWTGKLYFCFDTRDLEFMCSLTLQPV